VKEFRWVEPEVGSAMFVVLSLDRGRRGLDRWGLLCGLFLYFLYYWSDEKGEDSHLFGVPPPSDGAVAVAAAEVFHGRCRGGHLLASSSASSSSGAASGDHLRRPPRPR